MVWEKHSGVQIIWGEIGNAIIFKAREKFLFVNLHINKGKIIIREPVAREIYGKF